MPSVLIIGAGCTGAATAVKLREKFGKDVKISIWEKARGCGGRYTTSRDSYPDGLRADLGAQYSSVDPKDAESMALMEAIVQEGGAELMPDVCLASTAERPRGTAQYRGRTGQNGIIKAMLGMAKVEPHYERRVSRIDMKGGFWTVTAYDGKVEQFECVFLCVPGCGPGGDNLNKIHGNWERQLSDANWKDVEVPHDCRYSLALWFQAGQQKQFESFFGDEIEKRIDKGSVELAIWQSRKDGEPPEGPQVVVVHTPQGAKGHKSQAEPRMKGEICELLKINHRAVTSSKIITWFQSQVLSKTSKTPCLVASSSPALIMAGDYFTSSTFTGCVQSASAAATEAAKLFGKGQGASSTAAKSAAKSAAKPAAKPSAKPSAKPAAKSAAKPSDADETSDAQPASAPEGNATSEAAKSPAFNPPKRESRWGAGKAKAAPAPKANEAFCAECRKKEECFVDKSDGKKYCATCWKAYYGNSPVAGA